MSADVRPNDRARVLGALEGAPRLTRSQVLNLFGRHRSPAQLDALAQSLEADGHITRIHVEPQGGKAKKPVEVWEKLNSQSAVLTNGATAENDGLGINSQSVGPTNGASDTSGHGPDADEEGGPPPGEGWLPKKATLRKAYRGVVPAVAARAGRIAREKDRARKGRAHHPDRVSDEQRGAVDLVGRVLRAYRVQGIIEMSADGEWIRLVKNPTHRPPRHWYEALLHFLAEGHPTLDGKYHRPPKPSLRGRVEDALGRKLEPHEVVRRRPGCAGSWDPEDIILHDYDTDMMTTLADLSAQKVKGR